MSTAVSTTSRISSLDGLRGVAALIVLLDHAFLMVPALAHIYDHESFPEAGSSHWWFTMTPLRAVWAGQEVVYVFFILSGVVLTLSVLRQDNFGWSAYYPRRMVRLYLPVWGAVALAAITMALVPREGLARESSWLSRRADQYDPDLLRLDLSLLWGGENFALSPLWSLRWEVLFSLMLPLFVAFAVMGRRLWLLKMMLLSGCLALGAYTDWAEFRYLPMFGIGALLAAHWEEVTSWLRGWLASALLTWAGFGVAIVLLTARWWAIALGLHPDHDRWMALVALGGGLLLVLLAASSPAASTFLTWRPMRWLGLISFSLYLVHESVIIAVRYLLPHQSLFVVLLLAVPASILCAWLFHHGIESPANRLARRVG